MLRLLKSRVLLRRDPAHTERAGIVYAYQGVEDRNTATVVGAGPDARFEPGDRVVVSRWDGHDLADKTCTELGEERGSLFVLQAEHICMRNGAPVPGHVVVRIDAKASLFDEREGSGIVPVTGFIGLGDEGRMVAAQPTQGVVLSAGEGCDCKAGERVLVGKFNGCKLEPDTCEAMGEARDAEVRVLREAWLHELTGPGGAKHRVLADEVHGVLEAESAQ